MPAVEVEVGVLVFDGLGDAHLDAADGLGETRDAEELHRAGERDRVRPVSCSTVLTTHGMPP